MKSKWDEIKDFVNEKINFRAKDVPHGYTGQLYINYLHKAGFLDRPKRGHYTLLLELENQSIKDIQEYAYGDKKGQAKKLIRKQKLERLSK